MTDFGKLQKVSLSEIWSNEARDFTPWLEEHIEALGAPLGFDLEVIEREAPVGSFSLDLLAKDLSSQKKVVIENQFGKTDHDHLGKIITYASGLGASVVIWITEDIRDEHRQALEWLNQRTDIETSFFAVVVEVLKIDESKPAYHFKPIVFPNAWQKSKLITGSMISDRVKRYQNYFTPLVDRLREEHNVTNASAPPSGNWYDITSGFKGAIYKMAFKGKGTQNTVRVELCLQSDNKERNKWLFDCLYEHKEKINKQYEKDLEWRRLDEKKSSIVQIEKRVSKNLSEMSEGDIEELRQWHIDNLLKVKKIFTPFIEEAELKLNPKKLV